MQKLVVVINGAGGVGKDTLCNFIGLSYKSKNISSITPIKSIAKYGGWNGEKDDASRLLLAELKKLFTTYNDLCFKYLVDQFKAFNNDENDVMFVHIREPKEIRRFVDYVQSGVVTLLIRNSNRSKKFYGNISDDDVENYKYDYIFDNKHPLCDTKEIFTGFFDEIFQKSAK